jgi:hypothetical protein
MINARMRNIFFMDHAQNALIQTKDKCPRIIRASALQFIVLIGFAPNVASKLFRASPRSAVRAESKVAFVL